MKPLRGERESLADHAVSDLAEKAVVGVPSVGHTPLYQRCVYISSGQTFIGRAAALMHKLSVAHDPEFGVRLRTLIPLAGFKNPRRFAIDGMGWPEDGGPQRLNNHLKGRLPDVETLVNMATQLKVSVSDLLGLHDPNSAPDEGWTGILKHLLELEGIDPDKADTIASASLAAQRLYQAFPDEEPVPTRAKYAAHAAWLQQPRQAPGT